jgi:hypothetical protein
VPNYGVEYGEQTARDRDEDDIRWLAARPHMKQATAYKKRHSIIITPMSMTTAGVWIGSPPVTSVTADTDPAAWTLWRHPGMRWLIHLKLIGESCRTSPEVGKRKILERICQGCEMRSYRIHYELISIIPTTYEGSRRGFIDIDGPGRDSAPVPDSVGAVLIEGFDDAL